jgi:hypothetical protein
MSKFSLSFKIFIGLLDNTYNIKIKAYIRHSLLRIHSFTIKIKVHVLKLLPALFRAQQWDRQVILVTII